MTACPNDPQGHHLFEQDGPYNVVCCLCDAEGRVEITTAPSFVPEDLDAQMERRGYAWDGS